MKIFVKHYVKFGTIFLVSGVFASNSVFSNVVEPEVTLRDNFAVQSISTSPDTFDIWPRQTRNAAESKPVELLVSKQDNAWLSIKERIKRNNLQAIPENNNTAPGQENDSVKSLIIQNIKNQDTLDLNDDKTDIPSVTITSVQMASWNSIGPNSNITGPTNSALIKKYWWFKWYQQALLLDVIWDNEITDSLDNSLARRRVEELTNRYNSLNEQYLGVLSRKSDTDASYRQLMLSLQLNKNAIDTTTSSINKRIVKISGLQEKIDEAKFKLRLTIPNLEEAQQELTRYTQTFLKMNNDLFTWDREVSNIKLFTKHDNVAETLASDIMVKDLTVKLDELVERIGGLRTQYALQTKNLEAYANDIKTEVATYQEEQETLSQQVENYEEFMLYVKSNKAYIDSKKTELENEKKILWEQEDLIKLMDEAETTEELEEVKEKLREMVKDESTFFDFPIPEIKKVTSFFEDEGYNKTFGVHHHYALDFRLAQWSFVYAPADGYVYKIVNQNSSMLNWFIVLHQNNFATVYLHMQDIYVKPGQYINKGDIMWVSWWTPWTRGAGHMTTWPHLHREVWKWPHVVDPLLYTDLSMIDDKSMLQKRHEHKWEDDNWIEIDHDHDKRKEEDWI